MCQINVGIIGKKVIKYNIINYIYKKLHAEKQTMQNITAANIIMLPRVMLMKYSKVKYIKFIVIHCERQLYQMSQ